MSTSSRYGGLTARAYLATAVLGGSAIALKGPTDGRSFGLLAVIGAIVIVECIAYFRRPGVSAPKTSDAVDAPLAALAGIAAGACFVVVGALAAAGVIHFD